MNTVEHKGYIGKVEYSPEDECLFASVEGLRDLLITEADNVADLKANFTRIVDEYLTECEASGRTPEEQFSGHFQVRLTPTLHARARAWADSQPRKTSLNEVVSQALESWL